MQAVVISEFGPPEVLAPREVEDPMLGPDDVLIEVALSSVTFVETQIRRGRAPHPSMLPQLPAILGNGVGGTIAAVGANVDANTVGRRALAPTGGAGGYAALAAVPATAVLPIPDGVTTADAVAVLADGRTAVGLIELADVRRGETVLVEAAAGGVGSLLVQLAKRAGARVIATAGGERKLEAARALGADFAIDYRQPGWADEAASLIGPGRLDVVFDGVGGSVGYDAAGQLGRGGRLCSFGMASGGFTAISDAELSDRGVKRLSMPRRDAREMQALTARALAKAAAGELRPVIGQEIPLARAAEAHRAIEARETIGKTLLVP